MEYPFLLAERWRAPNATRRDEKKTEDPTSFDTFTVSINLPMVLLLHG
jgi:hypothetical protein